MEKPFFAIWRNIVRVLGHVVISYVPPRLYIVDDKPNFLTLNANFYTVAASKHEQVVTLNGQIVAVFKSIEAIHIRHFVSGAGNREENGGHSALRQQQEGHRLTWERHRTLWKRRSQVLA